MSLPGCGFVDPHSLLRELKEKRGAKAALEALGEAQVRLESNFVGPQQRGPTPRPAEVTHGLQQLLQAAVLVDHVGRQHVVIPAGAEGEVSLQVPTPGKGDHLRDVATAPPGVSRKVECQVWQDIRQVSSSHPSTCTGKQVCIFFLFFSELIELIKKKIYIYYLVEKNKQFNNSSGILAWIVPRSIWLPKNDLIQEQKRNLFFFLRARKKKRGKKKMLRITVFAILPNGIPTFQLAPNGYNK